MNRPTRTPASAVASNLGDGKQLHLKDIAAKWGKFSEHELGALKNKDELVTQVAVKYGIDKAQAQRDVDAVMKGRQILNWIHQRSDHQ